MGPYGYAQDRVTRDRIESELKAQIAEKFPGWDVHDVFGGFEAVPAGTPVIRASALESLIGKLAERREAEPQAMSDETSGRRPGSSIC